MRFLSVAVIVMLAAPTWAEEVLYCTETGFMREGGGGREIRATTFIVTVISETKRIITNTTGDKKGRGLKYNCRRPFATLSSSDNEADRAAARRIVCDSESGKAPWVFHDSTFARAHLVGLPAIFRGICVKN